MRLYSLGLGIVWSVGVNVGAQGTGGARSSAASEVYAALFAPAAGHRGDTLLVVDSTGTILRSSGYSEADWRKTFPRSVVPLLLRLAESERVARPIDRMSLPRPTRVVTDADKTKPMSVYYKLSTVVFSTDSLDAVVAYDRLCRPRCGNGVVAWLSRRGLDRQWRVQRSTVTWIS
jgi:hypothetical protein